MTVPPLQVASVVILKDDAVLLVRHVNSKHIEGIYGLPGGKVEKNEPHSEAARRELEEETGLTTTTTDLIPLSAPVEAEVTLKNGEVKRCEMHIFLCTRYSGDLRGTSHELPELVPLAKVGSIKLLPNVQGAIREALKVMK